MFLNSHFATKLISLCGLILLGVLQTESSKDLLSIHLPLLSNAFRGSYPLSKCTFLIFTSEARSSCSPQLEYFHPVAEARQHFSHHCSATHTHVPFAPSLFCTAAAQVPLYLNKPAAKDMGVYCLCTRWLTLLQALQYHVWGAAPPLPG